MTKKHVSLLVVFVLLFTTLFSSFAFAADEEWIEADEITINVDAHIQTLADQSYTGKGGVAFGTEGIAKRLERFDITLKGQPEGMELVGMAHVQSHGDLPKPIGTFGTGQIGTSNESKRIEGVAFKLVKKGTDTPYPGYRVGYAVHMQSFGWGISDKVNEVVGKNFDGAEDFAFDGTFAGTRGLYKRIESVSLVIYKEAKLDVKSVTAENLKQVVVEFNQKVVDNEEVEDVDNYALENDKGKAVKGQNGKNVDIVDVEINSNTAVLTFDNAVENQTDAVLVINKNVVGKELEFEVDFNDLDVPTVKDADVIGENMIKVIFSEPMDTATVLAKEFKVLSEDGKTDYRVRNVTTAKNGTEALVEVRTDFEDGDEVVLTVNNGIKDYAGFRVAKTSIDLTVVEDDSEIEVVDFRQAKEDGIILIFNKNITVKDKDRSNFYHTNSKNTVDKEDGAKADGNELTLKFVENELPTGTATIFIDGDSLGDYWGNTNEKTIRFEARISEDTVVPTIKKITVVDGRNLTVEFDKKLDKKTAEDEDNYSIAFSDGKAIKDTKIYRATVDSNTVKLRLSGDALAAGKYLLLVDGVKDIRGNAIKDAEKSFTIEGSALTDVTVTGYTNGVKTNSDKTRDVDYTILVDFGRRMDLVDGRYSIELLENYLVTIDNKLTTLESLGGKDNYYVDIDIDDSEKVAEITIEVEDEKPANILDKITISRVKDANGLLSDFPSLTKGITFPVNLNVTVTEVKATALDTIEVKLSSKIDYFEEDDIQLATTATTPAVADIVNIIDDVVLSDDGKKITITLDEDLTSEAKYNVTSSSASALYLVAKTGESETRFGGELVITAWKVDDGIAPEFDDSYDEADFKDGYKVTDTKGTTSATISLKFTEVLDALKANGSEGLVRGSFTLSDISRDKYTITVDGSILKIELTNVDFTDVTETTVKLVSANEKLTDINNNKVKAFEASVILTK